MTQQGDEHSPRVDDELVHETEALVKGDPDEGRTEGRTQQAPRPGEAGVGGGVRPELDTRPGGGLGEPVLAERSELAASLVGVAFPADRDALVNAARRNFADDRFIDALGTLPGGRTYETTEEVWEALGGRGEGQEP